MPLWIVNGMLCTHINIPSHGITHYDVIMSNGT